VWDLTIDPASTCPDKFYKKGMSPRNSRLESIEVERRGVVRLDGIEAFLWGRPSAYPEGPKTEGAENYFPSAFGPTSVQFKRLVAPNVSA
jgi:hypothetical protein